MRNFKNIEKAKRAILNRVRFHAPILYDEKLDKNLLKEFGVNISLPIFKFEKPFTKFFLEAFKLAGKEENFNLLIPTYCFNNRKFDEKDLKRLKKQMCFENLIVYDNETVSKKFIETINKFNINYFASSNYDVVFKDKFFKVNNKIINPHFSDFELKQSEIFDDCFVNYSEFLLNGSNFFVKLENISKQTKTIEIELNIPLNRGYYYFKHLCRSVYVENLQTKEKLFLNYFCKNVKFSFSSVDGLENSVFCCVNAKAKIVLKPLEQVSLFFNFGTYKFCVTSLKEVERLKNISKLKNYEIFDLRVLTKNPKFDFFFNEKLPQKIWLNWLNCQPDENLMQKYVNLRRLFVRGTQKIDLVNFQEIGLREIGIFNGTYYKKILFLQGGQKFLKVGKTYFWNINGITNRTLKSEEPVAVCFG